MKLFFYRRDNTKPNFGDELNLWLWEKLIPGILDDKEDTAFFGIGTLLNNLVPERVPQARKLVVFGTGVGYNKGLPTIDKSWHIYCVRGPISAYKLGLPPELAVTDGAALVRRVYQPIAPKVYQFAYMPHFTQSIYGGQSWSEVCQQAGIKYIDARWPVEQVLSIISQTEVLLTEAMHGAIIADALRVPWICVHTAAAILPFKWLDWCESIGVQYQPHRLMELRDLPPEYSMGRIRGIRGSRSAIRASVNHWLKKRIIAEQLTKIAKEVPPHLSNDNYIEQLTVELETRLQKFKDDVAAGTF
ncbi:polysaccharide pyruvyl transferase family protein [Lyngbya aestuarii]|uniref:polysaccharide pyruvyl transferase family protein n=1 Tax=Lyngbya aestuarii TaxID=118322 RepID=UPI00403E14DC